MRWSLMDKALQVLKQEGYASLLRKIVHHIFGKTANMWLIGYVRANMARYKLARSATSFINVDSIVDFAFSFRFLGISIKPAQVKNEIRRLLKLLQNIKPKVILEIGTANGGTIFLFTRVAQQDATLISIDIPGGPFGGGYPAWKIPLYKSFARPYQKIHLIRRDSHNLSTLDVIKNILGDRKVDFLFIDGDHTYEGVKRDFEMYSPLVRRGGIIGFHDIVPGSAENVGGVPKYWHEIVNKYKKHRILEIVEDWNQGGYGIGVIYV